MNWHEIAFLLVAAAPQPPARPVSIRATMEALVARVTPRILEEERRRISLRRGLLGVRGFEPPGYPDTGVAAPPLHLFPRAGVGNSLSVDPTTGRRY